REPTASRLAVPLLVPTTVTEPAITPSSTNFCIRVRICASRASSSSAAGTGRTGTTSRVRNAIRNSIHLVRIRDLLVPGLSRVTLLPRAPPRSPRGPARRVQNPRPGRGGVAPAFVPGRSVLYAERKQRGCPPGVAGGDPRCPAPPAVGST